MKSGKKKSANKLVDETVWVCNECNSQEYTDSISEEDLKKLQCSSCGCEEFHKKNVFDSLYLKEEEKDKVFEAVGAEEITVLHIQIKNIEKHMKFEHFLEFDKGYKKRESFDKKFNITHVSFHDWNNEKEHPGEFVVNNMVASFQRGAHNQKTFPDSHMLLSGEVKVLIEEYIKLNKLIL